MESRLKRGGERAIHDFRTFPVVSVRAVLGWVNRLGISSQSIFCGAALMSGLLSEEQLAEVVRAARGAHDPPLGLDALDDARIAVQAVEQGYLNVWQAEKLKEGRTKFTLGPYVIVDSIGRGGMGHVFKGEHAMLGRVEAVKVLPLDKTTPASIARFQREIRVHAKLDHPNLARLSYADQDGSIFFLVTEYVPGTDLRRLVRHVGKLTMQEAATVISQTAAGLAHAHAQGLVHRDVKPGNLLITPEGRTKVIDLGLAGFWAGEDEDAAANKIVGTADYLAPETIRAPEDFSPVSDIYSLGCTLYYAVTGKVPYPGGNTAEKLRRHCSETPLNPRRFNSELSDEFLDVLAEMIEKNPLQRVQTAAEVIEGLAPWALDAVPTRVCEDVDSPSDITVTPPIAIGAPRQKSPSAAYLDDSPGPEPIPVRERSHSTTRVLSSSQETMRMEQDREIYRLGFGIELTSGAVIRILIAVIFVLILLLVWSLYAG